MNIFAFLISLIVCVTVVLAGGPTWAGAGFGLVAYLITREEINVDR